MYAALTALPVRDDGTPITDPQAIADAVLADLNTTQRLLNRIEYLAPAEDITDDTDDTDAVRAVIADVTRRLISDPAEDVTHVTIGRVRYAATTNQGGTGKSWECIALAEETGIFHTATQNA